ncbi:MAG: hypothetical protein KAX49_17715 [Halanaerobiales bacterium]|nr:hypothetical protein [Halanaerobiales bacterium]
MVNITKLERKVLLAIVDNEYHDFYGKATVNQPVWVFSVSYDVGETKIFSDVMSSLIKKGLAGTDGDCCWVTAEGFEAVEWKYKK